MDPVLADIISRLAKLETLQGIESAGIDRRFQQLEQAVFAPQQQAQVDQQQSERANLARLRDDLARARQEIVQAQATEAAAEAAG